MDLRWCTLTHYKNQNQKAPSNSFDQASTHYLELLVPGTTFQGTKGVLYTCSFLLFHYSLKTNRE